MPGKPLAERIRAVLVLGRVSNLPTVWSNCLAAWLLGGSGPWLRFGVLAVGATLVYTGGMFLNDAFDVEFDRRYRPERPIISGQVSARFVWSSSVAFLALGGLCLCALGPTAALFGGVLVGTVVTYDAVHKRTSWAPILMAVCRFLLYLVAASGAAGGSGSPAALRAVGLAAYVIGLSYVARQESTGGKVVRWLVPLLFLPIAIALGSGPANEARVWIPALCLGAWIFWCISGHSRAEQDFLRRSVAGLLAGIALVDWLAATSVAAKMGFAFVGLFLGALLLQRLAPAT